MVRARGAAWPGPSSRLDVYPEPFFVEVGSNDGSQHDHLKAMIRGRPWRGIMVEPVPYVFDRLRDNYGGLERIALENVAIADREGRLPFYHLEQDQDDASLPEWYDAIGSFSRDAIASHVEHIPDIESRIVEVEVPALTFDSLCAKHDVAAIDLLLVDTEGYDHEILKGVDLDRWQPRLLIYEHYHLSPAERDACRERLAGFGYETMAEGFDTWCLRAGPDDALATVWRRARPGIPALSAHEHA